MHACDSIFKTLHIKCNNSVNTLHTQVMHFSNATVDDWEIPRSEIEVGIKIGQGNYGTVFRGQLTMTAMSPRIHAHKQQMEFEGKSHYIVALKILQCKCYTI